MKLQPLTRLSWRRVANPDELRNLDLLIIFLPFRRIKRSSNCLILWLNPLVNVHSLKRILIRLRISNFTTVPLSFVQDGQKLNYVKHKWPISLILKFLHSQRNIKIHEIYPQTRTNVSTYSLQDVIKAMIMASEMKRSKCNFPSTALVCVEHAAPWVFSISLMISVYWQHFK